MNTNQKVIIRMRGLEKRFQTSAGEVNALDGIDLDIYSGEIFGIIGMSGAGKSTLVRCINFLERPSSGNVYFDGLDLSAISARELNSIRQSMGMIFQQFNLLMQRNVLDNVCFPLEIAGKPKREARERARELLAMVGIPDKERAYPAQLSGGQKQRVAIARALATDPKVLLCDEATSALDPATTRGVLSLLKDINRRLGITIVIITHEMSVVEEICHRVAIIEGQKIAETGTVEEIFARPKTDAARRLMLPETFGSIPQDGTAQAPGKRCCRIVFDGSSSYEPVIAEMVLKFKKTVNILFADTKNIDGKAFGQIVIQLPGDDDAADRMLAYLHARGLSAQEVSDHA